MRTKYLSSLFLCLMLALTSCSSEEAPPPTSASLSLEAAAFSSLPGWEIDDHGAAFSAFKHSCTALNKARADRQIGCSQLALEAKHWQDICSKAANIDPSHTNDIRNFFEANFTPYHAAVDGSDRGLFTGYYIPEIKGSLTRGGPYQTPVYRLPPDLKKGEKYHTRAEIYAGKLAGRGLEIAWVEDPVGLFFVEVQGSGVIRLNNGHLLTIGYAGKNNQDYVAIGRPMEAQGMLKAGEVNLFTIKQWLYDNPDQAQAVMAQNPRYIFFQPLTDNYIRGAQGVPLTAQRSMAVDHHYIPYSTPVFLQTTLPETSFGPEEPFNQLMIAQDTGGAIRGGIRGDIYFGHGKKAEALAGHQAERGSYSLLLPKALATQNTLNINRCNK